ncbi:hypothetical protein J3R82DRAFT_1414 [Butyriboletus roseoflavus]|nr:hypothetical protein J3R82DRAFT_1414 [Butyriboletus roseoflavus]
MPRRRHTPVVVDHVSETDGDDLHSVTDGENDENRPINDENIHRSSPPLLLLRTPLSHSRASHDTPLRDITDQFFHPPSPSPFRVSKLKRAAPNTSEPPRRPKKPKSLAFPADPPNWLYSRSSSSLPPSSPFPPSTAHVPVTPGRHAYHLDSPSRASDSDPFGFVAVEHALKAKRTILALAPHKPTSRTSAVKSPPRSTVSLAPHKPTSRISAVKSPPRSTVLPSVSHAQVPVFASFSQLDVPVPTNNEDIEGLYADEPVAGPSHVHVPVAPLLMMSSDQAFGELDATRSQPTFPDALRTPRKRRHRASPTPDGDPDQDEQLTDAPSSPSPVKISVGAGTHTTARSRHTPVLKLTRAQTRAADAATGKPPTTHAARTKRVKTSYQHFPTPSSTRPSATPKQSTAPSTPVPPRRSVRQAAVGARAKLKGATSTSNSEDGGDRMKLRSRSAKVNKETKTTKPTGRVKHPSSKSKASPKTQKATTAKPPRGRPKGKSSAKDVKGKGKTRPLESVLDLSDDTRERYEKDRRERLEYFKRLEEYQIQKENVYVV